MWSLVSWKDLSARETKWWSGRRIGSMRDRPWCGSKKEGSGEAAKWGCSVTRGPQATRFWFSFPRSVLGLVAYKIIKFLQGKQSIGEDTEFVLVRIDPDRISGRFSSGYTMSPEDGLWEGGLQSPIMCFQFWILPPDTNAEALEMRKLGSQPRNRARWICRRAVKICQHRTKGERNMRWRMDKVQSSPRTGKASGVWEWNRGRFQGLKSTTKSRSDWEKKRGVIHKDKKKHICNPFYTTEDIVKFVAYLERRSNLSSTFSKHVFVILECLVFLLLLVNDASGDAYRKIKANQKFIIIDVHLKIAKVLKESW